MNDYKNWMNKKQEVINVTITPSKEVSALLRQELESQFGKDSYYENQEAFDAAFESATTKLTFKNKSNNEVQALVEPLRILNPDSGVSLSTPNGDFIGNVTWNDQMKMFWEYPTFTPQGEALAALRKAEAEKQGLIVSWE